ncbi:MAG: hypothetical protein J6M02_01385 [Clostridia bacterium]|nr:hypothetical protein [Clostridia bacterium]
MVGINKINEVAGNMLLNRIWSGSDFYEYVKSPAVMKVILSELVKEERKRGEFQENTIYMKFLKDAEHKVDSIFLRRKNLYNRSMEYGVEERKMPDISEHGVWLCKDGANMAEKSIMSLMTELLEMTSDARLTQDKNELVKTILESLSDLEKIDQQLFQEYQAYIEQEARDKTSSELTQEKKEQISPEPLLRLDAGKHRRRQNRENRLPDSEYVSEYSSQISMENLKKVPKKRRIRYVDKKETLEEAKKYQTNQKKTNPKVALALALLTACISVGNFADAYFQKQYEQDSKRLGIETTYAMEDEEVLILTNLILIATQDSGNHYRVPKEIMKEFQADELSKEEFVNAVFADLGKKVHKGADVSGILEYLSENLVKYKVCEALKADIRRYGDQSHYKEYEDVLSMENISLEFCRKKPVQDAWRINLGEDTVFATDAFEYQIPSDIQKIMFYCRKVPNSPLKTFAYEKDDIRGLYKALNQFRGTDLTISGNKLVSKGRVKDFLRE